MIEVVAHHSAFGTLLGARRYHLASGFGVV